MQQVIKQFNDEQTNFHTIVHPINKINLTYLLSSGPLLDQNGPQYEKINLKKFLIHNKKIANSYILTQNNDVIQVLNIIESKEHKIIIIVKVFLTKESIFEQPINSSHLNMYSVKNISSELQYWPIKEI